LPAEWKDVSVSNILMPNGRLAVTFHQSAQSLDLDVRNDGPPVRLLYQPHLPLGAHLTEVDVNGRTVKADMRQFPSEDQAHLEIEVPAGSVHCLLRFTGGASILPQPDQLQVGSESTGMKIRSVKWSGQSLLVDGDFSTSTDTVFELKTLLRVIRAHGAMVRALKEGIYELTVQPANLPESRSGYRFSQIKIDFTGP
jgi:hypothetical protein